MKMEDTLRRVVFIVLVNIFCVENERNRKVTLAYNEFLFDMKKYTLYYYQKTTYCKSTTLYPSKRKKKNFNHKKE